MATKTQEIPSFSFLHDRERDVMLTNEKYKSTLLEIGALLERFDELLLNNKPLSKAEEREKNRIANFELDEKLRCFIPVTHGFLSNTAEGNKARTSIFKLARFVFRDAQKQKEDRKL